MQHWLCGNVGRVGKRKETRSRRGFRQFGVSERCWSVPGLHFQQKLETPADGGTASSHVKWSGSRALALHCTSLASRMLGTALMEADSDEKTRRIQELEKQVGCFTASDERLYETLGKRRTTPGQQPSTHNR